MLFGPLIRRELLTSSRRGSTFRNRIFSATAILAVILMYAAVCDYIGRDRTSLDGVRRFALVTFGLIVVMEMVLTMGSVISEVAPMIAREREKKSLDALLATRLSGAEIVLGAMGAGMLRHAFNLAAVFPILMLLIPIWGIDPHLILLAGTALASFTFALSGLAVLASVSAPTARRALSEAMVVMMTWICLPFATVMILPRIWGAGSFWITPLALVILDSSPLVLPISFVGILGRGPFLPVCGKMIVLQLIFGIVTTLLAIVRLRAASRALYDMEGLTLLKRLARRLPKNSRPPCGDDPVFWHEVYAIPMMTMYDRILARVISWAILFLYLFGIYWFATPAYVELAANGYHAGPNVSSKLELHPLVRVLIQGRASMPPTGQARLELNAMVRQVTTVFHMMFLLIIAGAASESLSGEKERDTWLGLIATPLSGEEILRAKMLGSIGKMRGWIVAMLFLWLIGLTAGAIHPLGLLAALANSLLSCWLLTAVGVRASLWARDRKEAMNRTFIPAMVLSMSVLFMIRVPTAFANIWMALPCPPVSTWLSLVSYEEVREMTGAGTYPLSAFLGLDAAPAAWSVAAMILVGMIAQGVGAFFLTRSAFQSFDAAAGRPIRRKIAQPRSDVAIRPAIGTACRAS